MTDKTLLRILKIGHDTSVRGKGISLKTALQKSNYSEYRKRLGTNHLVPIIKSNPSIVDEWIRYSEDKRTTGGYFLSENIIGSIDLPDFQVKFEEKERQIAEFIFLELDYWSSV